LEENSPKGNMTNEIVRPQLAEVEELYFRNYGRLLDAVLTDRRLFLGDAQHIAESIVKFLPTYDRELNDEAFLDWFIEVTAEALDKLKWFYQLHEECKRLIYKALWMSVGRHNEIDDHIAAEELPIVSQTVQDLAQELWLWVIENYEKLIIPGSAKLSTRLFARARIIAAAWRKKQHVRRGAVIRLLYGLTVEEHEQRMDELPPELLMADIQRILDKQRKVHEDTIEEDESCVFSAFFDDPLDEVSLDDGQE
jgi:hypothetical protein